MSVRSSRLILLLRSTLSLLVSYLLDLSVPERGVLKFQTIIVDLSVSLFSSISFCLIYFSTLLLGA